MPLFFVCYYKRLFLVRGEASCSSSQATRRPTDRKDVRRSVKGEWIKTETDRRITLLETERGMKFSRRQRRELHLALAREMKHVAADVRAEIERDRERALYPDLARRLEADGLVAGEGPVYLRMGELPASGESRAPFGYRERGVSVFAGSATRGGHYILKPAPVWLRGEVINLFGDQNRPAWFVRGKLCGTGTDGEPLLAGDGVADVEPVPDDCLVAIAGGSAAVDGWNVHRFGGYLEDIPELAHYFEEGSTT